LIHDTSDKHLFISFFHRESQFDLHFPSIDGSSSNEDAPSAGKPVAGGKNQQASKRSAHHQQDVRFEQHKRWFIHAKNKSIVNTQNSIISYWHIRWGIASAAAY
jgi:hypothetical protein